MNPRCPHKRPRLLVDGFATDRPLEWCPRCGAYRIGELITADTYRWHFWHYPRWRRLSDSGAWQAEARAILRRLDVDPFTARHNAIDLLRKIAGVK